MTKKNKTSSDSARLLRRMFTNVRRRWLIVLLPGLAAVAVTYFMWPSVAGTSVSVVRAERRELVQTVVTTGRVRPQNIRISSLGSGEVLEVGAREGDSVAKGTLLARLDDREARASLAQARARLDEAKALKRRVSVVGIKDANEQLVQAKVRLVDAERKLERLKQLLSSNAVTQQQFETAQTAAQLVGLGDRADSSPRQLSGGQQQRVAIARAIAANPSLVLADEPTGNLDTETSEEVFALLEKLNKALGMSFLIVTHDQRIAQRTERIIEIVDGRIVSDVPSSAAINKF